MRNKRNIILAIVFVVMVLSLLLGTHVVNKSGSSTTVDPLATVKSSIPSVYGPDGVMLQDGGFTIENIKYFDGNTWMVANAVPTQPVTDTSTFVAKKEDGLYKIKVGPGTLFSSDSLGGVPNDVVLYLNDKGMVYVPDSSQ